MEGTARCLGGNEFKGEVYFLEKSGAFSIQCAISEHLDIRWELGNEAG